jgi:protein-tyrosine kinase
MSIISKAINKLKSSQSVNSQEQLSHSSTQEIQGHVVKEGAMFKDNEIDASIVDIPLHESLDDQDDFIDLSKLDLENLDFDLSSDSDDITGIYGENILSIDTVKPFSYPVDLDLNNLKRQGYITPDNANTALSNSFRMIKRPILNNVSGKGATVLDNANLIMVTSSLSEEGKSFSALNLALSIAMEKNRRVLLIDADVNKPSHHKVFGLEMEHGLTDLLLGKVNDMSRVLLKTNIPSLSLMFAGTLTSHATELLASEAMEEFVREISSRYPDRVVIFDSPPLLLTTESSVLAQHMGQIIMVVEAEKTLRHQVSKSLSLLRNEIILLMLNKMREKNDASNYGYYGYGHQG